MKLTFTLITLFILAGFLPRFATGETMMSSDQQRLETVYVCPMHPDVRQAKPGLCPICGMALVPEAATEADQNLLLKEATPVPLQHPAHEMTPVMKEEVEQEAMIYICPMHPQIQMSAPGSCPICQMDLQPLSRSSAELPPSRVKGFASIQIDPRQQWLIGVKTTEVVRKNLVRRLRTVGTVAYDPNLYMAQKEYLEVLKTGRSANSKSFIEAARRRLILLGMSSTEIATLEEQGKVDESLFLTEGTGKAWIYSVIYESERPLLREGLEVEVQTVGHPQMQYLGRIDSITPVVNPQNRTIRVRSAIEDPLGMLQPDMFVNVYLKIPLGEALTVPKGAVLQTGLRNIVMVAKGNGIFEPREVILGNQSNSEYQIISGLRTGEIVVSSANFLIDSESQIRGAFESVGGGQQHDH